MAVLRASTASFSTRQRKGEASWYVLASWPSGSSAVVPGFETEAAASSWILTQSADWIRSRQTGSHDQPARAGLTPAPGKR